MKAVVHHGRYDVRVDDVPDPKIEQPRDAIVKVSATAICGSDLHLYDDYIPKMRGRRQAFQKGLNSIPVSSSPTA